MVTETICVKNNEEKIYTLYSTIKIPKKQLNKQEQDNHFIRKDVRRLKI